ncbi:MAG: triose-phosphate isomerase [Candidatus Magasanikbacteria bacterium]|jgi:triosephosphate isomerase (TIM)|nr:triose-phosphate isomerase [Candidatus Magasanikbacteria bacterium]MBT5262582.1 triose-phosphate isomerase [Candidatus Magasanikbacteria bacterium]MBT5819933.1 triose-phosphate isomerase [Candidatus Magasanikbacteria bacterium]MBT6294846.1 triose-phosphate isomerase [Candidatus Magasanikbacteria bacterium]
MTFIFANWKMYLNNEESLALAKDLSAQDLGSNALTCAVFPTMLSVAGAVSILKNSPIAIGAQNVAWAPKGAYTGAVSAQLCKDVGCTYVLIGHSERRHIFGEKTEDVRKRIAACIQADITPVLCIGETREDKERGTQKDMLKTQILGALEGLDLGNSGLIVAYEPVWAISGSGNGDHCNPAYAQDIHTWIRSEISTLTSKFVPLLYGGSVNQENVVSYTSQKDIDGVLVGSASIKSNSFLTMRDAVASSL